jgi:hypothetical protein
MSGAGVRIWRKCEKDSMFIFWRNIDSIQASDADVIIRQTGMIYQLVFETPTLAQVAYEEMILAAGV